MELKLNNVAFDIIVFHRTRLYAVPRSFSILSIFCGWSIAVLVFRLRCRERRKWRWAAISWGKGWRLCLSSSVPCPGTVRSTVLSTFRTLLIQNIVALETHPDPHLHFQIRLFLSIYTFEVEIIKVALYHNCKLCEERVEFTLLVFFSLIR
jgi:hypothetical protein